MNKVFTSWSALKVAVQKEMQSAMKETVDAPHFRPMHEMKKACKEYEERLKENEECE